MSKTVWHPASELPPLHEESIEDDGMVFKYMVSEPVLALLASGLMKIVEFDRSKRGDHWFDDYGTSYDKTITHWAFLPEPPEDICHG